MSSKTEKKENREPLFVEILEYDNLEIILSKIVVSFSKFERISGAPDLYSGSEKIPFEPREPLFVEILEYDNLEIILSKIVVSFSKFERISGAPDLYSGSEKIPFEPREPLYKSMMRQEFAEAMRAIRKNIR